MQLEIGDIIMAINEENVGSNVEKGMEMLTSSVSTAVTSDSPITLTVCRRVFSHMLIVVDRGGHSVVNGKSQHFSKSFKSPWKRKSL